MIPNHGRFPSARFSLGALSLAPTILDLNDARPVEPDFAARKLTGIEPVWLEIGPAYGEPPGG